MLSFKPTFSRMAFGATTVYGGPAYTSMSLQGFGDFTSWKSTVDSYNCMLLGQLVAAQMYNNFGITNVQPGTGFSAARSHTGAVGAVSLELVAAFQGTASAGSGAAAIWGELPGVTGQMILTQPIISQELGAFGPRGMLKELYHTPQGLTQALNIRKYDLVPGVGAAAGRKLMAVPCTASPGDPTASLYYPATFIDVTGPWE